MYKHTRGKWHLKETYDRFFILSEDRYGAQIAEIEKGNPAVTLPDEIPPEQARANAILICGSAELLESSEQFITWFKTFVGAPVWEELLENCPELRKFLTAVTWSKS